MANPRQEEKSTHNVEDTVRRRTRERLRRTRRVEVAHPRIHFDMGRVSRNRANPAETVGTPADMACAALFLASALASYVVGQTIVVDGGLIF